MNDSSAQYLIGVDGGGSGCRAAIADGQGRVLGRGAAGPANVGTDPEQAVQNVSAAIRAALHEGGLNETVFDDAWTHVGLAGVLGEAQAEFVRGGIPAKHAVVTDDRRTFLAGALGNRTGILLAVGTGTIIAASRKGAVRFVNGWGMQVSDQGSGAWLGRAVIERALLSYDDILDHSGLTLSVLADFGTDPSQIVDFARNARPAEYAAFAPRVCDAAENGDPVGIEQMRRGADFFHLALDALGIGGDDVLCLAGGLGPRYARWLRSDLQARIVNAQGSALDGALRLARIGRLTGQEVS